MTTYHKLGQTTVLMLFFLLIIACTNTQVEEKIDLSTPEATINTYCKAEHIRTIKKCFYSEAKIEEKSFNKRIWSDCAIVEKRPSNKVGLSLGVGNDLVIAEGDIEIVTEVKMIDPAKHDPRTKFWYLLRNFGGDWKIISHSHIPDNNYPAYE